MAVDLDLPITSTFLQITNSYCGSLNLVSFQILLLKRHAEIHQKSTTDGGALQQYSDMTQDFLKILSTVSSEVDGRLAKECGNSHGFPPWANWTGRGYFAKGEWQSGSS